MRGVKPCGYTSIVSKVCGRRHFPEPSTVCIFVYSLLTLVVFVVVSPYFLYQAIRYKKYIGSLRQRLGYLPITFNIDGEESIWIHAVSVGEALTARALAADLKARYPRLRLSVDDDDRRAAGGAAQPAASSTRSSIFRSTGPSSSAARSTS